MISVKRINYIMPIALEYLAGQRSRTHYLVRNKVVRSSAHRPAVNHHGPSVGHSLGLDSPNKPQQACGVIGHAVVRPAREVKLPDLPDLVSPSLRNRAIMLNTQRRWGEVVRRQRIQRTDGVGGHSTANTHFTDMFKEGLCKFPSWHSKQDVQGCCSLIPLPTLALHMLSSSRDTGASLTSIICERNTKAAISAALGFSVDSNIVGLVYNESHFNT